MKPRYVLLLFLLLGLSMVGLTIYYAATVDRADRDFITVAAPDGKYKAVRMRIYGDKPVDFCVDTISVYLSVYPESFAASKRIYEIYTGNCPAKGQRDALPKIEWTDHKSLRVTYANEGDKPPRMMREQDASHFVDITWVKAE